MMFMWLVFIAIVSFLLLLDLGVFNRRSHVVSLKESLGFTFFYFIIALAFGLFVRHALNTQAMMNYYTGYLVELSLSMDNLFVMSLIFSFLAIPAQYQHRILFWGILGVIVFRAVMIGAGAFLVSRFEWMLYIFGVFLVFMGIKMLLIKEAPKDFAHHPVLKFLHRHFRVTSDIQDDRFLIKKDKKYYLTPLAVALILIETADVIFAVDSIPAIFAITQQPFVIYTSNIFAILGLRSMYFCLAFLIEKFVYLKQALAAILIFIGGKIFIAPALGIEKFPAFVSLGITVGFLMTGIFFSVFKLKHLPKINP